MNLDDFVKYAFSMGSGAAVLELLKHYLSLKKNKIEHEKGRIEIDTKVSDNWIKFCIKLEEKVNAQEKEIQKLKLENMELNEKCISLQQQITFGSL